MLRAKDADIEREARLLLEVLGIEDVEVVRDDTVAEAWLDDLEARRTIYGLDEIRRYLEQLVTG